MHAAHLHGPLVVTIALSLSLLGAGCSEEPGNGPGPTPSIPTPDNDGAPVGRAVASWGVGDDWYDNGANHTVTPQNASWLVTGGSAPVHITVDGFYGPTGLSSMPSMTIQVYEDQAWSILATWRAAQRVRDEPQCLAFTRTPEAPCDGAFDIIWRTDVRPLPETGFSISNPGFYVSSLPGRSVYRLVGRTPPSDPVAAANPSARILSVLDDNVEPILQNLFFDDPQHSVVQLTGDLYAAQWQMRLSDDTVSFESRCIRARETRAASGTFTGPSQTLQLDRGDLDQWTFIDLCNEAEGPTVSGQAPALRAGRWPSNATFDLALQRKGDELVVWPAPESIFEGLRSAPFEDVLPPAYLWQN